MSLMKMAVMVALFALFCLGGAADIGSLVAQLDDPLMKEIIGSMRAEFQSQIEAERKDKEALWADMHAQIKNGNKDVELLRVELDEQNKSKVALRIEVQELRTALYRFLSKTDTAVSHLKADILQTTSRLD